MDSKQYLKWNSIWSLENDDLRSNCLHDHMTHFHALLILFFLWSIGAPSCVVRHRPPSSSGHFRNFNVFVHFSTLRMLWSASARFLWVSFECLSCKCFVWFVCSVCPHTTILLSWAWTSSSLMVVKIGVDVVSIWWTFHHFFSDLQDYKSHAIESVNLLYSCQPCKRF